MRQDEGFVPSGEANDEQGVRRGLWREYEDNVDWTDHAQVARVLRVYETLISGLDEAATESTRKLLDRYRFKLNEDGRISPQADSAFATTPTMPRSLNALRE